MLVIEDDEDSREMLCEFFSSRGHDVLQAATGPEGLRRAREERPAVVFLDIALPGLSGIELAGWLRGDPATSAIVLVATTGRALDASAQSRFDAVAMKPLDLRRLDRLVQDLVRSRHARYASQ